MENDKTEILLEVKNLKQHFPLDGGFLFKKKVGAIRAVDGVSFELRRGETLGLVGESGCGKSTTARAIAQLYKPTAGEVILDGEDLNKLSPKEMVTRRRDVQMVFQDPYASLNPRMTVGDIIAEPMIIFSNKKVIVRSKSEIADRVEWLMEKVGLNKRFKNRYPHEFSGGQRQRIGIARALALNPKLILADEPVSALDVSIQSQILNLLKDLQEEFGLTYLFIAHDLAVIEYICDRIAVMYLGTMVEISPSSGLYKNPLHPYTKALLSAVPIPDPEIERKRKRITLEGDVPSPDTERVGCYFYDRCAFRMDHCKNNIPKLSKVEGDHKVACFLYHDVDGKLLEKN
ncbi:ABC transporter ATP-binding protein [Spirochaeta cellobiosiphila]|uniref:ABC transporter ATP-binding protein n=1 Tax=Spirochaeta cellobiosiphila TaxID=504483 RepID=UPI0003F5529A|nr:oligopeptide/dipeptide ABC transporter ATP-binding protein [Spirochaeta cellobiosiphila]